MRERSRISDAGQDDVDLKLASRELATARHELRAAHDIVEKRERREAIKAALSKLALVTRQIEEVVTRRTRA